MTFYKPFMVLLLLPLLLPSLSNAAISFPALDIQDIASTGDTGVTLTSSSLNIDATVFTIILDAASHTQDITDQSFTLTSTSGSSSTATTTTGGNTYNTVSGIFAGNFNVGGGLLSGTFTGLNINGLTNNYTISGNVSYTSGSLMGVQHSGRLEFAVVNGTSVTGKLGQVTTVPAPAALWLFGSGLLGLAGVARRKKV